MQNALAVVVRMALAPLLFMEGERMADTKLTSTTAKSAAATGQRYTIWGDPPGLGLAVSATGKKTFVLKFRIGTGRGAKQVLASLGPYGVLTLTDAQQKAKDWLALARTGADPRAASRHAGAGRMTLNDALDVWERDGAPYHRRTGQKRKASSVTGDLARVAIHVRPTIGHVALEDLRKSHIEDMRDAIANGKTAREVKTGKHGLSRAVGGQGTAFATLRILKSALNFMVDREMIADNPMRAIKIPPTNETERFPSGDELARLGKALDAAEAEGVSAHAINMIRLLALTGARKGEIQALRWHEVDMERGFLLLRATKTGKAAMPMGRAAMVVLESLPRTPSPYVFPAASGDGHYQGVDPIWRKIRKRAGLDGLRLHDLRHGFVSMGAASGMGLPVVGKLIGHKSAAITRRYAHIADAPLRQAADGISDAIAARMTRAKPVKAVDNG